MPLSLRVTKPLKFDEVKTGDGPTITQRRRPAGRRVTTLVLAARAMHNEDLRDLHVWGHDHDSAYQQFHITRPELAVTVLLTDFGPTVAAIFLSRHRAFGRRVVGFQWVR